MAANWKDMLDENKLADFARFAELLAKAAAGTTLPRFRTVLAVDDKAAGAERFDPVTEADRGAERAMRALIEAEFPDHGIIGEEYGDKPSRSGFTWVLDPVDGTRAFIAGLPTWGTLVALNAGGRPVLGLVSQPYIGETFVGISAGAVRRATLNGKPIRTRPCAGLAEAILSTTGTSWFSPAEREAFDAVEQRTRLVRYGFDCYAYAVLAAGFIDLVIEAGLKTYDIQALIPLIEGAGGHVTTWRGEDATPGGRILAAGDPRVHEAALDLLSSAI